MFIVYHEMDISEYRELLELALMCTGPTEPDGHPRTNSYTQYKMSYKGASRKVHSSRGF